MCGLEAGGEEKTLHVLCQHCPPPGWNREEAPAARPRFGARVSRRSPDRWSCLPAARHAPQPALAHASPGEEAVERDSAPSAVFHLECNLND